MEGIKEEHGIRFLGEEDGFHMQSVPRGEETDGTRKCTLLKLRGIAYYLCYDINISTKCDKSVKFKRDIFEVFLILEISF